MSRSASSTQTVALPPRSEAPSSKVQHPTRGKEFADKISVLCIPNGPEHGSIPEGARKVRERGEMPDVVVLTEANAARLMADYLPASAAAIIPVIVLPQRGSLHTEADNRPGSRLACARSCRHRPENHPPRQTRGPRPRHGTEAGSIFSRDCNLFRRVSSAWCLDLSRGTGPSWAS